MLRYKFIRFEKKNAAERKFLRFTSFCACALVVIASVWVIEFNSCVAVCNLGIYSPID